MIWNRMETVLALTSGNDSGIDVEKWGWDGGCGWARQYNNICIYLICVVARGGA